MAKAISFILILAMIVQIIKPFGFWGMRRRSDFWKIAVFAFVVVMLLVFIRPN